VSILILVGYSCITSLYYVAFGQIEDVILKVWEYIVEVLFITDLLLNFFTEITEENSDVPIRQYKEIAI